MNLTQEQRRAKIVLGLKELFKDIEDFAKETHGREETCHDLICDLEDEIGWEQFSKLRTELMEHVRKQFIREEDAYTEKHLDDAKEWIREHRHEKKDRDNLAGRFALRFNCTEHAADIDFEEVSVHITKRHHNGVRQSRYLSDAELVETWEAETSRAR